MKKANVVNWFEIYADDIKRAQKFYEAVLAVEMIEAEVPDPSQMKMTFFPWAEAEDAPNAGGALSWMPGMKPGGNGVIVYFACEDCKVEESRVEAAGGKVLQPKFSIGEFGFCSMCLDTEGNTFGLHSVK